MYTVGLYTLGCKVSLYETEAIAESFRALGFEVCPFDRVCDVYVINTCTVTRESDAKSRKYIRRAVRKNPSAVVCVIGCYSQNSPEEVKSIAGVSVVLGTRDKMRVSEYALDILTGKRRGQVVDVGDLSGVGFEPMKIKSAERTRAYVKIEDGCECKCTYCAISAARGPVRSKPKEDIISEVEALSATGVKEIVLTGIETGSWGVDLKECGLADLIVCLDSRNSCGRIRLGSMAPELVTEEFLKKISQTSIMTPHIHLSVQSASSSVLRAMKRRYNSEMLYRCVDNIKKYMPEADITADLMVGFPGETEEDFKETFDFVSRAGLLDAHVFAYSKRDGTPAAEYPNQVPDEIKNKRSELLIKEVGRVREAALDKIINRKKPVEVIFETAKGTGYIGHSASYAEVFAESESDVRGESLLVEPQHREGGIIYGKIIK